MNLPLDDLRCTVSFKRCRDNFVLREDGSHEPLACAELDRPWVCPSCAVYRALAGHPRPMREATARAVGVLVEAIEDRERMFDAHTAYDDDALRVFRNAALDAIAALLRR